jgi:hypothetical protein
MATPQAEIVRLAQAFVLQPVSPETTFEFESGLGEYLREVGRRVLEVVFNHIEPAVQQMPKRKRTVNRILLKTGVVRNLGGFCFPFPNGGQSNAAWFEALESECGERGVLAAALGESVGGRSFDQGILPSTGSFAAVVLRVATGDCEAGCRAEATRST